MAELLLLIAPLFSVGLLLLLIKLGVGYFHSKGLRMVPQTTPPDCLGRMTERHCEYCSNVCPVAARCVLLVMDDYMREHPGIVSSQDSSEQC